MIVQLYIDIIKENVQHILVITYLTYNSMLVFVSNAHTGLHRSETHPAIS